jgi:hypothetical protein
MRPSMPARQRYRRRHAWLCSCARRSAGAGPLKANYRMLHTKRLEPGFPLGGVKSSISGHELRRAPKDRPMVRHGRL